MSRTPLQPHPEVARAVGASLFGGLFMAHVLALPRGFELQSYLGVFVILSALIAWAGAFWLLVEGSDRAWRYAAAIGSLTVLVWFLTQLFGLPVTNAPVAGDWSNPTGLLQLFFSANLAFLAAWVLRTRRLLMSGPVRSARDRARRGG